MDVYDEVVRWAQDRGVELDGVAPRSLPGRGVGIVATRPLEVSTHSTQIDLVTQLTSPGQPTDSPRPSLRPPHPRHRPARGQRGPPQGHQGPRHPSRRAGPGQAHVRVQPLERRGPLPRVRLREPSPRLGRPSAPLPPQARPGPPAQATIKIQPRLDRHPTDPPGRQQKPLLQPSPARHTSTSGCSSTHAPSTTKPPTQPPSRATTGWSCSP
jgi:hypothetical protein